MFNIGTGELILIAVLALLVLGPKRLPELARGIGKFVREFRRQTDDVRNVVEREFYRMDQEINTEGPKIQPPADSVPQTSLAPEGGEGPAAQIPLDLTAAPQDESDPGHPDHYRQEKVNGEASTTSAADPSPQPSPPAGEREAAADPSPQPSSPEGERGTS